MYSNIYAPCGFCTFKCIDLNDNTFTEVGSKSMAEALPNLQKLRVINFGDCLVRQDGGRAIAEAIKDGHQLLEVRDGTGTCCHDDDG